MKNYFRKGIQQIIRCSLCVFAILAVSCAKDIVDVNGSIQGLVKDYNTGALISNCQVSLSPSGKSTLTGSEGMFSFNDLEPGSYTLSFSKAGYDEESKKVTVVSGETTSLDITLKAKSAFAASSNKLDFGDLSNTMEVFFFNNSDENASFSISNIPAWATFSHTTGSVSASGNMPVTVSVNRDIVDYGTHTQIVSVAYKGKTSGTISLTIQMQKVKLSAPTVKIGVAAEDVTQNGFTIQGELSATGGAEVTSYGHCWSLTQNPTIDNYKTDNGATTNTISFKSIISDLTPGTTYYVRAYATNQYGTGYSQQIAVTTQDVASNKWDGNVAQSFARGSGTSVDPYIIETGGQLLLMKDYSDSYFELANNIDLDNHNWLSFEFKGSLDGKGCVISNLNIERNTDYQGLFSKINNGNVQNLTIKNVTINAPSQSYVGALSGYVENFQENKSISNCHVILTEKSQITGNEKTAGLIGCLMRGSISECTVEYSGTSTDVIKGNNSIGGLIGLASYSYKLAMSSCQVFANVKGSKNVGGIVGNTMWGILIEQCAFKGIISGEENIGGVMGYCKDSEIIATKADVELTASKGYGGGLVGCAENRNRTGGIAACYATGTLKSNSSATTFGGLLGGVTGGEYYSTLMSYSTVTSQITNFDGIAGVNDSRFPYEKSSYTATIGSTRFKDTNQGGCKDITSFLKACYQSDYDKYWNYNNTWTWTGDISGEQVKVSCPRLSWE